MTTKLVSSPVAALTLLGAVSVLASAGACDAHRNERQPPAAGELDLESATQRNARPAAVGSEDEDTDLELARSGLDAALPIANEEQINARYTRERVCEDYEVALHLLALVQSPAGRRGDNVSVADLKRDLANCPGTFVGVARELAKRQSALKDFHTDFRAGEGLDANAYPVVASCTNTPCELDVGTPVFPMISEVSRRLYVFSPLRSGANQAFELESVDGKNAGDVFDDVRAQELLSRRQTGGSNAFAAVAVLGRRVLDERSRAPMNLALRNLSTQARFTVRVDYEQLRAVPLVDSSPFLGAYAARAYGCSEVEPGSSANIGACVTTNGRGVVWVRTWSPRFGDPDPVDMTRAFFAKHRDVARDPVLFDTRGNGGGSPSLAARFVCAFGDDRARNVLRTRRLVASRWPERLALSSGRFVAFDELYPSGNNDLAQVDAGWVVSSSSPDATRRDYTVGFLERFGATDASCAQERAKAPAGLRWIMLMNGREFSAAENFLSFVEKSLFTVKKMGARTWGGTGAPISVTLPNTRMRFRLSQARHIDGRDDDAFKIEGVGVAPDMFIERDLAADFEARAVRVLSGLPVSELSGEFMSNIVRYSFGIRM